VGYPDLGAIDVPTRIVWGTKDKILPLTHLSSRFRRMVPQADWVEIPGAGHLPQIDDPERVAELVLEMTGGRGAS
jgi:pimeloyl-ACP methyl ester carboxylesterase